MGGACVCAGRPPLAGRPLRLVVCFGFELIASIRPGKVVFVLGISVAIPLLVLTLLYRKKNKLQKIIYDNELELFVREKLQLETVARLQNALSVYLLVAWRLLWLTYQSRTAPEQSCAVVLETHEWQALHAVVCQGEPLPSQAPTLQQAVLWIARLRARKPPKRAIQRTACCSVGAWLGKGSPWQTTA